VSERSEVAQPRRATPRPTFDGPSVIRRDDVAHHVWGDAGSSLVTDRVYLSNDQLHVLEFELPPRSEFRHSESNKTVFAADVVYCVLDGELVVADPEFGEVQIVEAGSTVFFRRDSWHHGFNPGGDVVRVVEFFAPPPSRGTASDYARRQPDLPRPRYRDDRWDRRLPDGRGEWQPRLQVIESRHARWSFAASAPTHLLGTLVDTEFLTVAIGRVFPGHVEDPRAVDDDSLIVVTAGELWVDLADPGRDHSQCAPLCAGDAAYASRGSTVRLLNRSAREATYLLGSGHVPDGWTP
jgi:hypothetical protein